MRISPTRRRLRSRWNRSACGSYTQRSTHSLASERGGRWAVVSLHAVVNELEALGDESAAYLNRVTGELYTLQDDEMRLADDDATPQDLPAWQRDGVPKIHEVLESQDWLALPTRFDIHEWAIMDEFARSVGNSELQDELLHWIRGRGAFRHSKDAVYCRGIHEDWYRFRTATLSRIATDWLDERGIAYTVEEDVLAKE